MIPTATYLLTVRPEIFRRSVRAPCCAVVDSRRTPLVVVCFTALCIVVYHSIFKPCASQVKHQLTSYSTRMIARARYLSPVVSYWLIPVLVFAVYLLLNSWTTGPAYLSDEVSYLDKAATLAGSTVHASSSWYGGYSLLISPAFLLSKNPFVEWRLIITLNALMWAGSAWLLTYILRQSHPERSTRAIRWASAGAMLYPSWIAMSGYAFATSGFVLVLLGSLAALIKSQLTHRWWLAASCGLAGFLCWIHPLGYVFATLLMILLVARAVVLRRWSYAAFGFMSLLGGAVYVLAVDPWFRNAMQGSAIVDNHYATGLPTLQAILTLHFWLQAGQLLIGLLLFFVVATCGLTIYGTMPILRRAWARPQAILNDATLAATALVIASTAGTILLTALLWGVAPQLRIDQWVYGRYSDMYVLPLIGAGLLATWRARTGLWLAAFSLAAGIVLSLTTDAHNTSFVFDNKVNIQALWPMHVTSILHLNYYWLWGVLGAIGVVVVALLSRRKTLLVVMLVPVLLADAGSMLYHRTISGPHAQVSTLYNYIQNSEQRSSCLGFTTATDSNERFALYAYYLHGYTITLQPLDQWLAKKCGGLYMTYTVPDLATTKLHIVGRETYSGLYILARPGQNITRQPLEFWQ